MDMQASRSRQRKYATADEIRQRVGILDAAQMLRLPVEQRGGKLFCRCFCERHEKDNTPSVFLDESDDHFHCFIGGCTAHGNIFRMVCVKNGWDADNDADFRRAKDEICQHFGIWPSMNGSDVTRNSGAPGETQRLEYRPPAKTVLRETRDVLNAATAHYSKMLWQDAAALNYVRGCGLTDATMHKLKLGYAPGNTLARALFEQGVAVEKLLEIGLHTPRGFEKLAGYIILPVLDGDDTIFMQGRSPVKNPEQKHDSLPEGLAHKLPMAMGHPHLGSIVAEGSFDFATPIQWGLDADYAIVGLLGTGHNLALSLRADWLVSPVILGLDQDCAGKRIALQMQERLAEQGKHTLIPVDLDRLQSAQGFISSCATGKQALDATKDKRLKSAIEHVELVEAIRSAGCMVEVRWGGRKDLNDLLMWGSEGRRAFKPVLDAVNVRVELPSGLK